MYIIKIKTIPLESASCDIYALIRNTKKKKEDDGRYDNVT